MNIDASEHNVVLVDSLDRANDIDVSTAEVATLEDAVLRHFKNIYRTSKVGEAVNNDTVNTLGYFLDYIAQLANSTRTINTRLFDTYYIVPLAVLDVNLDDRYYGYLIVWRHNPFIESDRLDPVPYLDVQINNVTTNYTMNEIIAHSATWMNYIRDKLQLDVLFNDPYLRCVWIPSNPGASGQTQIEIANIKLIYRWESAIVANYSSSYNFKINESTSYSNLANSQYTHYATDKGYITFNSLSPEFQLIMIVKSIIQQAATVATNQQVTGNFKQALDSYIPAWVTAHDVLESTLKFDSAGNKYTLTTPWSSLFFDTTSEDLVGDSVDISDLVNSSANVRLRAQYLHVHKFKQGLYQAVASDTRWMTTLLRGALKESFNEVEKGYYNQKQSLAPANLPENTAQIWIRGNMQKHVVLPDIWSENTPSYFAEFFTWNSRNFYFDVQKYCDYLNKNANNYFNGSSMPLPMNQDENGKYINTLWPRQKAVIRINSLSGRLRFMAPYYIIENGNKKTCTLEDAGLVMYGFEYGTSKTPAIAGKPNLNVGVGWRSIITDLHEEADDYERQLFENLRSEAAYNSEIDQYLENNAFNLRETIVNLEEILPDFVSSGLQKTLEQSEGGTLSLPFRLSREFYMAPNLTVDRPRYMKIENSQWIKIERRSMLWLNVQSLANFLRYLADLSDEGVYLEFSTGSSLSDTTMLGSVELQGTLMREFRLIDKDKRVILNPQSAVDSGDLAILNGRTT